MKTGIVLEGGAFRGLFTAGTLDCLMDNQIVFDYVVGVSAGAGNAVNYLAGQKGRTKWTITASGENAYYGVKQMRKSKKMLDLDRMVMEFSHKQYPFDFEKFVASPSEVELVVTNCETGKAEYKDERMDKERLMKLCRASSSMPLLAPMVNVDGTVYLDGGVADSIPIERAMEIGNEKTVVVLTRNPGYRKKPTKKSVAKLYQRYYKKYPNLVKAAIDRNIVYNQELELIEKLEDEGKIFVIRPLIPTVSRLEQNPEVLMHFYMHGYRLMKRQYSALVEYLES